MIDCLRSLLRPVVCLPSAAALLALALSADAAAQTVPPSSAPAHPVATASTAATVPASSMASRVLACTACHGVAQVVTQVIAHLPVGMAMRVSRAGEAESDRTWLWVEGNLH